MGKNTKHTDDDSLTDEQLADLTGDAVELAMTDLYPAVHAMYSAKKYSPLQAAIGCLALAWMLLRTDEHQMDAVETSAALAHLTDTLEEYFDDLWTESQKPEDDGDLLDA